MKTLGLACMIIFFLSGCHYQSTDSPPPVPVHHQWSVSDRMSSRKIAASLPTTAWWLQFHDSELNRLVRQGLV
ncbi:MAG: hypothetical protein Q8L68_04435, partial [Methylococcales bacterium]|nr:hypothetical protein [Methylococcales bacterium]